MMIQPLLLGAAPAPAPSFTEELFIFDDVTGGAWTTQYPTLSVTAGATIIDPRPFFSQPPVNYPTPSNPKQALMFVDGTITITFQRDYVNIQFDYLAEGFTLRLLDASNTEVAVIPVDGVSGAPTYRRQTYNMPLVGTVQTTFRKARFIVSNGDFGWAIDNLYVKSIPV